MKSVEEVTACVCDYGTFECVAEKLGETMAKVYYYSPVEDEYQDIRHCVQGRGLEHAERLDEPLDPAVFDSIDLFVFPDIGFSGLQKHLRSLGKAVWGHFGATDLELYRDYFLEVLEKVGLPTIHSERIVGLSWLANYLKKHDNQWVKVNRYRANLETWKHTTWGGRTERTLDSMAVIYGGAKEQVVFIVQDDLESDREIGYDGWCIDGQFPPFSFQGYEKKNELYLGSLLSADDLPEEIKIVNDAMAPVLRRYGYRDWWATEIRVKDGIPYFIDPTPRMAGQTMEHQLETMTNFAEMVWMGANGILIPPDFNCTIAVEATLHYESATKDAAISDEWKTLDLPPEVLQWMKLYHYCKLNGLYHFMSKNTDEIGVMIGRGDSVAEAYEHLSANLDMIKDLPVHANVAGFASLLESVKEAESQGLKFGGSIPEPEEIFKDADNL